MCVLHIWNIFLIRWVKIIFINITCIHVEFFVWVLKYTVSLNSIWSGIRIWIWVEIEKQNEKKRRKGHHYAWATFTLPGLAPSPPHGPVASGLATADSLAVVLWHWWAGPCLSQTHHRPRNCCVFHVGPARQIALPAETSKTESHQPRRAPRPPLLPLCGLLAPGL
jgi:hypothetical protein